MAEKTDNRAENLINARRDVGQYLLNPRTLPSISRFKLTQFDLVGFLAKIALEKRSTGHCCVKFDGTDDPILDLTLKKWPLRIFRGKTV